MIYLINTLNPILQTGGNIFNNEFVSKLKSCGLDVTYLAGKPVSKFLESVPIGSTVIVDSICLNDLTFDWGGLSEYKSFVLLHMAPTENTTLSDVERAQLIKAEEFVFYNYPILAIGYASIGFIERKYKYKIRYTLIPNFRSVDFEKTVYSSVPSKFIAVGSVSKDKGTDILIESLSALVNKAWTCDVYGAIVNQQFYNDCKALVHASALNPLIKFHGLVSQKELHDQYCLYDLLIHTSLHENSSIAIKDAILIGLPFVTTPTGDFEQYKKIYAGMISDDFSTIKISETIHDAIDHYPHLVARAKVVREIYKKETENVSFEKILNLLVC